MDLRCTQHSAFSKLSDSSKRFSLFLPIFSSFDPKTFSLLKKKKDNKIFAKGDSLIMEVENGQVISSFFENNNN